MAKLRDQIPEGRPPSLDEMAILYAPLVGYLAKRKYNDFDLRRSLDDVIQDGWIGAIEAFNRYNPLIGMIFRSYATNMITWAILNGARRADPCLGRLYVQCARQVSPEEQQLAMQRYHRALSPFSLGLGETGPHYEIRLAEPYDPEDCPEQVMAADSFAGLLRLVRRPRVRWVLDQYYRVERTLDDIGKELGVSRERVRQIMCQGHDVIRRALTLQNRRGP